MGSWGTLLLALKHRELFSSVAVINAAIYTDQQIAVGSITQDRYDEVFGALYGKGLSGYHRINTLYKQNPPLHLLDSIPIESLKEVKNFLDCANDDFLIYGNMQFQEGMRKKNVPHEFRVRDGSHTWTYWREGMVEALSFIDG